VSLLYGDQPIRWAWHARRCARRRTPNQPGDENVDHDEICALRCNCCWHRRDCIGCDQETENDSPSQRHTRSEFRSAARPACQPIRSCSHRRWYPWLQSNARAFLTKKWVRTRNFADVRNAAARTSNFVDVHNDARVAKGTSLTLTTPRCQQFEQVFGTRIGRARCHVEVGAARDSYAPLVPRAWRWP
jgi:hypothetical protein